jgi:ABC-type nitrate/sulfonate/bicarbonate transport system substrate-binding protein
MKVYGASKREELKKLRQDVSDIEKMLIQHPGPLLFVDSTMAEANKDFVRKFVPVLAEYSYWPEKEWRERLGI